MAKDTDIQVAGNLTDNFRGYAALLRKIKQRVLIAQQRMIYVANEEMLRMYWDVGEMLQQSQDVDGWGKKTLQRLAVDLKNDYSEIKGFSVRNMQCMMQFFNEYNQELTMIKGAAFPIAQPLVAQLEKYNFTLPIKHLGWMHNLIIMQQVKDIHARYWYMVQAITSHWSKRYLQEAIRLVPLWMIFFAEKEITGLSDCCFARAKTVSKLNTPCAMFRSLSEFPTMNWDKPCRKISEAACLRLKKSRKNWSIAVNDHVF